MHDHPATRSSDLLVGFGTSDDAGVLRLPGEPARALVQTADFFTPIVDDAYDWGRIAAANALSDVYAMGGEPLSALQLVGWPREELSLDLLGEVVRGGCDVMAQAGCLVVGGHSIDDREPTYGFAVTGLVDPDRVVTNAGARPGDLLLLTKPIGTGIVATAIKAGACPPPVRDAAVASMTALNAGAARAMTEVGVSAATDVTGFGLLGHLAEVCAASGVGASLDASAVPVLPGAWDLLDAGFYPGGSERNLAAVRGMLAGSTGDRTRRMLADAQTSGGLLIAVTPDRAPSLLEELASAGVDAAVIGEATAEVGRIVVD